MTSWGGGAARRVAMAAWIAILLAAAVTPLIAEEAAAQTVVADSVGELGVFGFVAWYTFVLLDVDCIQTRLRLNAVVQQSVDYGCGSAGARAFDALVAPIDTGRYTLEIESTNTGQLHYTRSWNVPAIGMTASVTPTAANAGDSVVVSAVFRLLPGGPDAYITRGVFTVDAGTVYGQDITVTLFSARDLDFWIGQPSSAYETFTASLPVSFGTSGSRSVEIRYQDAAHSFVETRSVAVTDPSQANLTALEDEIRRLRSELSASASVGGGSVLAAVATVLGLVGIAVGLLAVLTARRALRAFASVAPRPPVPPVASAPTWLPPVPPAEPPSGPRPGEPGPPGEPPPPGA